MSRWPSTSTPLARVSGNILLIGNSGTGKTTIINNIRGLPGGPRVPRLPGHDPSINANLLVDSDRMEFRPERLFSALDSAPATLLGHVPTAVELKATMQRATICIDEIDKSPAWWRASPTPLASCCSRVCLTLMEGRHRAVHRHVMGRRGEPHVIEIDTAGMMFSSAPERSRAL